MSELICPGCGVQMLREQAPDVGIERCPQCQGAYLDRGELNALATGAAGDIEFSPIDVPLDQDRFPPRICPKCPEVTMEKVNLLRLPDLIFDLCPDCKGFYLDHGEFESMNEALRRQAPNQTAEEFRGEHSGHLVRIDRADRTIVEPLAGDGGRVVVSAHLRISVYFRKPLPGELRIYESRWTHVLAHLFNIITGTDVKSGDDSFDQLFSIHSKNREQLDQLLTPACRKALTAFVESKPSVLETPGELSITPEAVTYTEGPYSTKALADMVSQGQPVVGRLIELAGGFDAPREA
jgi:Zn-finger nucleic acid-binding protein